MYAVDPRLTDSAKFADAWLGIDVGTDIALANALAREIIASDLHAPNSFSTQQRVSNSSQSMSIPTHSTLQRK